MSDAASIDPGFLLPHLADLPGRMAALAPAWVQAQLLHADAIASLNQRYAARAAQAMGSTDGDGGAASSPDFFAQLRALHDLHCEWLDAYLDALELPPAQGRRLRFLTRQWMEARDPRNFPATNPEVLRATLGSGGENLIRGQRNYQADLAQGRITMSDRAAFQVGRNLATTAGSVIHENDLIQLIRYRPLTAQVRRTPLLIVPPFINKYYILDLSSHNSFVRHALQQGFQVFMISWRNIGPAQAGLTWDDYAEKGVVAAIDSTLSLSGANELHALGFCVGGTLLASALASAAPRERVCSLTLLASLLDFSDVGDIGHYVDDAYVARCEQEFAQGGIMPGARLAAAFASLRPRELVWRYVIGNYYLGQTPPALDLLHWNNDSANLPGRLFTWYVRELYLRNRLREPGALQMQGMPVDLRNLRMPLYALGTAHDHIVPWRSAYLSALLMRGPRTFVLGGSGHIAGVVSPPATSKRGFRTAPEMPPTPEEWLTQSTPHSGSWWPHWYAWLASVDPSALRRAPRQLGNRAHPVIEDAPGRYVSEVPG